MNVHSAERLGHWMHTAAGGQYWPMDPRPEDVNIETIAHHLANKCRYNGATQHPGKPERMFYSVAEHSVYCSYIGPASEALERLLHDASEAYNGDLIRPLKYDPMFAMPFRHVEGINEAAVAMRFGLKWTLPSSVKIADEAVTATEVAQIIKHPDPANKVNGRLHDASKLAPIQIACLFPHQAKRFFLHRFKQLWNEKANCRRHPLNDKAFGCYAI